MMDSSVSALAQAFALLRVAAGEVSAGRPGAEMLRRIDRWSAGDRLSVEVSVPHRAWLVVHALTREGGDLASRIVGRVGIEGGHRAKVDVPLSAPVEVGQDLLVLLHADKGKIGEFEFARENGFADNLLLVDGVPVGQFVSVTDAVHARSSS